MTKLTVIQQGLGDFVVKGDLTFTTIDTKTLKSFDFSGITKQITIDLTGVASTDSAGLALMIEWIKYASVERELPNKIHIAIIERTPIALGQKDKKLYLIDDEGVIINQSDIKSHLHLPIIIGEGAEINANSLIKMLRVEPDLFNHISSIIRVSERRWNVRLDNKIEIKMPEENFEQAWQTVIKLYRKNELLNKDLKVLDLRIENKIFVEKY